MTFSISCGDNCSMWQNISFVAISLVDKPKSEDITPVQQPQRVTLTPALYSYSLQQLIAIFNLEWDAEGRTCLHTFRSIRDSLSTEMDLPLSPSTGVLEEFDQSKTVLPSYEIIVAEVRAYKLL
jgi:hypothetical protein